MIPKTPSGLRNQTSGSISSSTLDITSVLHISQVTPKLNSPLVMPQEHVGNKDIISSVNSEVMIELMYALASLVSLERSLIMIGGFRKYLKTSLKSISYWYTAMTDPFPGKAWKKKLPRVYGPWQLFLICYLLLTNDSLGNPCTVEQHLGRR